MIVLLHVDIGVRIDKVYGDFPAELENPIGRSIVTVADELEELGWKHVRNSSEGHSHVLNLDGKPCEVLVKD